MQQLRKFVVIFLMLLSSCASAEANLTARIFSILGDRRNKEPHRVRQQGRRLAITQTKYTTNIFRQWETDQPMTTANAIALADQAKRFIARNIPTDMMDTYDGIEDFQIISVFVAKQTLLESSPTRLWVQLEVNGIVDAKSNSTFDSGDFPFTQIVETAIRAQDNAFQRLVEPLVVAPPAKDNELETSSSSAMDRDRLIILVSLNAAFAVSILLVSAVIVWRWIGAKKNRDVPLTGSGKAMDHGHAAADLEDEQSLYTERKVAAPIFRTNSSVAPHPEEISIAKSFENKIGWSFSLSSEGGSPAVGMKSADGQLSPRSQYRMENVHSDLNVSGDTSCSNKDDEEDSSTTTLTRFSPAIAMSPMEHVSRRLEDSKQDTISRQTSKPRLCVADMEDFDDFISSTRCLGASFTP